MNELNEVINDTDSIGDLDEGHDYDLNPHRPFGRGVAAVHDQLDRAMGSEVDEDAIQYPEEEPSDGEPLDFG